LSKAESEPETRERAARLRAAIEEGHEPLLRTVAVLVARSDPRRRWPEVMEVASEVLQEAVREALEHAHRFDPARSAAAWVRGIAARLLSSRRRVEARARRCVPAAVLGQEAWAAALGRLRAADGEAAVVGRLDLEQVLGHLSPEERLALECRCFRGLDGEELASALGVPTPGAARVRVCRALQALRAHFPPDEGGVNP